MKRSSMRLRVALALLALFASNFSSLPAQAQPATPAPAVSSADDAVLAKLDPRLRTALPQGPQPQAARPATVMVDVVGRLGSGAAAAAFFEQSIVRRLPARPLYDTALLPTAAQSLNLEVASGVLRLDRLRKVASIPSVERVLKMGAAPPPEPDPAPAATSLASQRQRLRAMRAGSLQTVPTRGPQPEGWFEQGYVNWERAWAAGYTGKGVNVAVLDSGIDFAHPDLEGLQARVRDASSPYFYQASALSPALRARHTQGLGLPMAFDAASLSDYLFDQRNDAGNWGFYIDTSRSLRASQGQIRADGVSYRLPPGVQGEVRLGFSSDEALRALWGSDGAPMPQIAILLAKTGKVDLDRNGRFDDFDTVYTDLNNDHDFSDDKPASLGDEVMRWDGDGDGLADLSGGMLYFIADGRQALPAVDWLYGQSIPRSKLVPAKGDLVALMVDDPSHPGGEGHGTRCASAVASKAVINGDAPALKPDLSGPGDGLVQAAGKDVRLIPVGNLYAGGSVLDWYQFIFFGYDGAADSPQARNDDPQLVNMSFGSSSDTASYDVESRLLAILNRFYNPYVLLGHSAGNGGPGLGTTEGPDPWTALTVGAATQYDGQNEPDTAAVFEPIQSLDQATYGDMTPFSNTGPDNQGTAGVDIAGNGAWGTGDVPLNSVGSGATAWELWGGTSRATPTVLGSLTPAYEAWRARTGRWPNYREARDLAMSAATFHAQPPHASGAGLSNAGQAALSAAGLGGTVISPARWVAGSYGGRDRQESGQANLVLPGQVLSKTFSLSNPAPRSQRLSLRAATLVEIGQPISGQLTTIDQAQERTIIGKPDYLVRLPQNAIPAEADLMVVRAVHSFESFDADNDARADSYWRLLAYDWTDRNGNGRLWDDRNGDGYVDGQPDKEAKIASDELDVGEYNRFGYSYATGPAQELRVSQPRQRSHDGLFIGWEHRVHSKLVPTTTMRYEVRFYQYQPWNLVALGQPALTLPAGGTSSFSATLSAADTVPGYYEGFIFADAPGSGAFLRAAHLVADAPAVDVYLDGAKVLAGLSYRQVSNYLPLPAGKHRVQISAAGSASSAALLDTTINAEDGSQYTLAAMGTLAAADSAPPRALLLNDENYTAPNGQAKLRLTNSVANGTPLDVYVGRAQNTDQRPGQQIAAGLVSGRSTRYLLLGAGAAEVRAYPAGSAPASTRPLFEAALMLSAGRSLAMFAAGDATRPATLRFAIQYSNRQLAYPPQHSSIPVSVNIGRSLGDPSSASTLLGGNATRAASFYDNSFLYGTTNWGGGGGVDDNRRFWLDAPASLADMYLLTHSTWGDAAPTDIDTLLLGPEDEPCEAWFTPCNAATRALYEQEAGSSVLNVIGGSPRTGARPVWRFNTSTGSNDDWGSAPIRPGLHQLRSDQVLNAGRSIATPFSTTIGVAQVQPSTLEGSGSSSSLSLSLRTNLDLPGGLKALAFGLSTPQTETLNWAPNDLGTKEVPFSVSHGGLIDISSSSDTIGDVDIALFYDANNDGVFADNEQIAISAGGSAEEQISVKLPKDGKYLLRADNFSQTPGSATLALRIVQGQNVSVSGLPTALTPAGTPMTFTVQISNAPAGRSEGILFFGPATAPTAFEIPIRISN